MKKLKIKIKYLILAVIVVVLILGYVVPKTILAKAKRLEDENETKALEIGRAHV